MQQPNRKRPDHKWSKPSADRILDAGELVFAANGYGETSLRMLMHAASVSTTAFYARFDSKAAVLIAIAERFFRSLNETAARSIVGARSVEEGIEQGIYALCDHLEGRKPLVRLIIAEAGMSVPTLATRRNAYGVLVGFLAERIRYLSQRKRIAPVADPDHFAWAVVGALEMQVVRWAVWDEIEHHEMRTSLLKTARVIMPPEIPPETPPRTKPS